ncbi:hypothetical protein TrVFT333_004288 [Trichoderma virens FT-333]|nr:hypothetical protein TrVFT333_004288 [Trichoderma virens FT-333]
MNQLRDEIAHKTASSEAIDEALKNSLKIREEMKRCTEEYRMKMEKDVEKRDQVISELKEKLALQEALLAQEKSFADKLRAQTEDKGATQQCVRTLEAKVDSLMAHHAIQNEQRESDAQHCAQMMSTLNLKLDSLLAGGNLLASKMLSPDTLDLKLAVAEKNIIDSMLPAVLSLKNGQSDVAIAMSQLEASIRQDLDHFKDEASKIMSASEENKEESNLRNRELLSHVQAFDSSLKKAESYYEHMGQKFDAISANGQSNQRETIDMLQNFLQKISAREINSDGLERQLQKGHEEFMKKAEAMISEALNNRKETIDVVRSATDELRATLEQGFGQEREMTAQMLQGNENVLKALTAYSDEQKQLATQTDHKSSELQATLESEREAAAELGRKIQELEQKSQETENLRDRWLKDVEMINKVRSQIKAIEMRIPQVENYDKKLDRIVEISRSIQSSASYLATEEEWVQLELAGIIPKPDASEPVASCEITTAPLPHFVESNVVAEQQASIKEDAISRKVTVHSPDPGEVSPSPPLTVIQEQKRRREVTQLRSILKSHALHSAVEPDSLEGQCTRPPANHGKANQASSDSLNKPASASAKEVVAEIRSRMIQHDWSFPTVADFERDIELSSKKRHAPQGNPVSLESIDADHRDMKKLRTEYFIE